jgi:hypothetical protein
VVYTSGNVREGIYKDGSLFEGRKWDLNDTGSYDLYQLTQGKSALKEKGV